MSIFDEHPLTSLDQKAYSLLGDKVVIKSLAQTSAFHRLPRYVAEYLIAKYVRPDSWQEDLAKIRAKITELLPDQEHRELLRERLLAKGEVTLIDNIEVKVDLRQGQRWARVPSVNDDRVRVSGAVVEQNVGLLLGGLWGTAKLRYRPEVSADTPNELVSFTPFQVGPPDLDAFRASRAKFTSDEWTSLMLQSAGYSVGAFPNRRIRLLLLARLIPLVERNVNLIELGPRQTGKTFLLRNLSPRVFTVSGGRTTPANLFVNLATRQVGILGTRKTVVFDEISHTVFSEDETISTLKDYMESGQFSRGALSFASDAGLVFTGNLDVEGQKPHSKYAHLLEPLPENLIDSAFQDRIHGYLPGWEIPKIGPASVATGVGFVTDYFGEVLVRMRENSYADRVRDIPLHAGLTKRDQTAVERIGSGLIKLLYPDGNVTDEGLIELVTLACELRQRVHDQLVAIAPGEFRSRLIAPACVEAQSATDLVHKMVPPQFDRQNIDAIIGAVTGLGVLTNVAGDEVGGEPIIIQVSAIDGPPRVEVTGLHGRTMSDSVRAVYNLVRSRFSDFGISDGQAQKTVAVHLVRIATPREGPSAGLAFLVGIVSALSNRPIRPGFAFTGEVALHGEVGAVGGLEHKIRAAARAGRKHVVIPAMNANELTEFPEELKSNLTIHPVATAHEAVDLALESAGPR